MKNDRDGIGKTRDGVVMNSKGEGVVHKAKDFF